MDRKKIPAGEHTCIRDDNERIYSPDTQALDMLMPLVDLTYKTRATHSVHDFTNAAEGRKILSGWPLESEAAGLEEIHVFSPAPIKNGDMIVTLDQAGKDILRLAFDVEAAPQKNDIYKLHAVRRIPDLGIGHAVPAAKHE